MEWNRALLLVPAGTAALMFAWLYPACGGDSEPWSAGGTGPGPIGWDLPGAEDNCVLWGTGRGGWLRQGYVPPEG